ncbi:MAG: phosphonoacetate hydrolase [Alphaproteobacteria bacterium]|nr:phosphonoacetate hydrolase [Alphaproteobacteria bacterium]MCB9929202.1 phosphonoacetate hydrolase [Alphaproteobacteria bacterium]
MSKTLEVNDRPYAWPAVPSVVICADGLDMAYLEAAEAAGRAPFFARARAEGRLRLCKGAMPSFTNPNNCSIVTGQPPAVHGIAGNFFLEPRSGEPVMMNDPGFLRAPSILAEFSRAGASVVVITAKDKLRRLLGHGLDPATAICFSTEFAADVTRAEHGIDKAPIAFDIPSVYSAEVSAAVFAAGLALLESHRPDLMYLSTTDYIQHLYAPEEEGALDFTEMVDGYCQTLANAGAHVVLTADHGMNAKHLPDGRPNVAYLQDFLDRFAPGAMVILPITDPYVVHHGALGSFATVYVPATDNVESVAVMLRDLPTVELVITADEASEVLDLPRDRIGDLCVLARRDAVLGTREEEHDLSALTRPLRSHGGLHEQPVPMVSSHPLIAWPDKLRNYDAFDVILNRIREA